MPGYGGGVGGDSSPGNEGGAGGGSGMGGGTGGGGGGSSRSGRATLSTRTAPEREAPAPPGLLSRVNDALSRIGPSLVPGLGVARGMGMLSQNLADMFGVELGTPGATYSHDTGTHFAGSGRANAERDSQRGGNYDVTRRLAEVLAGRTPNFFGESGVPAGPLGDVRGWGSSPAMPAMRTRDAAPSSLGAGMRDLPSGQSYGSINPFGSERWIGRPGAPSSTRILELHPAEQQMLDSQRSLRGGLFAAAPGLSGRVTGRW